MALLQAAHREVGAKILKPTLTVWCKDIQNAFCCEVVELVLGIILGMTMNCACIRGNGTALEMVPVCFPQS